MRKILLFILLSISLISRGQWTLKPSIEYDYTRIFENNISLGIIVDYQLHEVFNIEMGLQYYSIGRYSTEIQFSTELFDLNYGRLYLENRYLYRLFPRYNKQEFTAVLNLAYLSNHFNIHLGLFNRYFGAIPLRENGGQSTIFEPMNLYISIEAILFKPSHQWNISAKVSNYRDFVIEHFTLLFYSINTYLDVKENMRFTAEIGLHPTGTFSLSSQQNGFFLNAGLIYKLNKQLP